MKENSVLNLKEEHTGQSSTKRKIKFSSYLRRGTNIWKAVVKAKEEIILNWLKKFERIPSVTRHEDAR